MATYYQHGKKVNSRVMHWIPKGYGGSEEIGETLCLG